MNTSKLLRGALAIVEGRKLYARAAAEEKKGFALLNVDGLCWSHHEDFGMVDIEIKLADYLTLFPKEKPTMRQWESIVKEGTWRMKLEYPSKFVGEIKGMNVWVSAATDSVECAKPSIAEAA